MATNNQRREAAKRQLEQQLAQRQRQQSHKRGQMLIISIGGSIFVVLLLVLGLAIAEHHSDDKKSTAAAATGAASDTSAPTSAAPTSAAQSPTTPGDCDFTKDSSAAAKAVTLPPLTGNPVTGTAKVTMNTSQGVVAVTVDRALAPCTVESFLSLSKQKYYNDTPCHRLVTSGIYVLQCGDPTGSGSGGPGYTIPDEATGNEAYPAGTLAMARTSTAHSGGSQFFFVYKDSPSLAQNLGTLQYTVFGKVTTGLDVLQKIAAGGVADGSTDGSPKLPVQIKTVTVS
ncbi:peptidyl-prolyl cis-trans isomerase B (cyclophilin B) [Jatrophihabitans sp. GAS493]|uniref:peptidylprolyl isomerase n=1 Tax=Jatrophihabitans sp. GAS493 TaxID=1907575 RepID=UPI000BC03CB0|nr:peptidylprolyl isomerase [Jatrophihabitans sp. GAS493]SOD74260.1 peptidyl-prolyl cis-trans isomerase B (cyclophilin B) [Jatrophihabitans sp. GAS493]